MQVITEERAADVIAGYMVMTAVAVDHREPDSESVFESGMYESFAPTGPWLVTKDEVAVLPTCASKCGSTATCASNCLPAK